MRVCRCGLPRVRVDSGGPRPRPGLSPASTHWETPGSTFFPCPSLWVATGPVEKEVGHNQRADCVRAIVLFGTKGSLVLWAESETGVSGGTRGGS